jgi:thiamine biosynthesis lipoprotein
MRSHSSIEIRRCRPLLGTFVEVATSGTSAARLERGIGAAFVAIEKVQRLMSFHDPASDVSRMNREGFPKSVLVHPWTWKVLEAAQQFARESDGVFDIAIARRLANRGYLPQRGYQFDGAATWRDIFLRKNYRVFFRRRLMVDLGGIAKGFAVDQAVAALKESGAASGIVNAGGDLRVFGSTSQVIHLRHPSEPSQVAGAVRLRERAMATSGIYFARRRYRGRSISPMIDGRTGRSSRELISVSVAASDCMTADALTKIVFALRERAAGLLAQQHADGLLLERDGAPSWMFHSSCDTPDQTRFD